MEVHRHASFHPAPTPTPPHPACYPLLQNGKICAEYVWIGGTGQDLRSKSRTLDFKPTKPEVGKLTDHACLQHFTHIFWQSYMVPAHAHAGAAPLEL